MSHDLPKVGVALIIRRNGKLLMGLRKGPHAKGTWGCPGGHLDPGEEWVDAARRETAEECGVKTTQPVYAFVTNDIFPDGKHYVTIYMVADYVSGEAQLLEPDKFERWEWVSWEALPEPLMLPYINAKREGFNPFRQKAAA